MSSKLKLLRLLLCHTGVQNRWDTYIFSRILQTPNKWKTKAQEFEIRLALPEKENFFKSLTKELIKHNIYSNPKILCPSKYTVKLIYKPNETLYGYTVFQIYTKQEASEHCKYAVLISGDILNKIGIFSHW